MTSSEKLIYNLPDQKILDSDKPFEFLVWQPQIDYLVLGQSNKPESSLILSEVEKDNIFFVKRPSGGETVLLSEKMLVISLSFYEDRLLNPKTYFKKINESIIEGLKNAGVENVIQRGISDLAIGEKKILGSSIFRKPKRVFYHAVLNVAENVNRISKYIAMPGKEPDYRKGRSHRDFVTSLREQGFALDFTVLSSKISEELRKINGRNTFG